MDDLIKMLKENKKNHEFIYHNDDLAIRFKADDNTIISFWFNNDGLNKIYVNTGAENG